MSGQPAGPPWHSADRDNKACRPGTTAGATSAQGRALTTRSHADLAALIADIHLNPRPG
jgi:hypothetical protein